MHPSIFTHEAWVSCSAFARLFYIGLWTDADDQGIFEWRPLQLKMRLLPADPVAAPDLLAELVAAGLIASFSVGSETFGAIKDFRKYQRPKRPNAIHPLPAEWRLYVAIDSDINILPDEGDLFASGNGIPPKSEIGSQMEDEGGRMKDEERGEANASVIQHPASESRLAFDAYNATALANGWAKANKLTDDRRRRIGARLKDCGGLGGWDDALRRASESPYLMGATHHKFETTLDFLLQPSSFTKLSEGFYDGRRQTSAHPDRANTGRLDAFAQAALELAEERRGRG